ncbi:uncharacterized protein MONOS_58 [Monocercomonoides exilis]|uniref:uncharacterized protein n=1 Tax=Monocercomonoides exilis TaxID=2049356 RepID=UPI00355942AB|nr:hypothetical protein MONOS_58 [Monocercomonoides exilis]|eukprot:MONOS_58.1-p1 / transcript=MONOS_58.1 / gene=MONOS_58 / organism=Monocercomonoides_exilis_PA203 / gene_product=unspecified product / transcript_product=unspecified product / location=Mono_scaffold00001:307078-309058(+) / protein_length=604 / sequence_SO=supercontig / SO=protein_coding / is_pseudo=false
MMFGGRKRNVAQDTFKFIRIFENWTFNAFEDNGTFLANKMHLDIVEAGCTVHDRKVICFGGRQIDEKRTIMPAALDTFRIIRLNENLVPCSPDIYGKNECEKCPLGTYRNLNGSIVPNCLPVPAGKFTNTEGAYVIYNESYGIENCTEDQYCPIGSASTNNKDPHLETLRNEQPKPLELNSMKEIGLMVGLYLGSIFVGVVVVLILLCLPTKSYLYKLDNYSDKYVDSLDRDTHSAIKHIKKTTFGGSVSIVAIFFVIGALVSVLLTFSFFNTNETRTTLDVSMDENADVSKITNKQVKLELILKDYTGYCIGPPKDTDRKQSGKCSDYLGLGKTTFDAFDWYDNSNQNENVNVSIECTQVPSINHFHTYTHDCEITLTAKDVKLFFENSQAMFFSLFSSEREASCRAIKVHASVDSAVPKQKKKKGELDNYQSIIEDIFVSDEEHVLHGSNPSNITIELIPSIFKDETKKKKEEQLGKGHLINHISFECGSLANSLNIFSTMGFGFNVFLKLEKTVAITQRSYKITFGMLITSLGGTFVYLGYFGNILPIFETLMNVNWPCGRRMKKKISSVFHDSSKKLSRRSAYREYEEEMKTALDEHIT